MRTTLTLDPDVSIQIQALQKERGLGLKALINELLRLGLVQTKVKPQRKKMESPTEPQELGNCRLGRLVSITEALALAEGDDYP